jgi:hypothetical protein
MIDLIADTGWSLTYVPRAEVNALLLRADPADWPGVLLAHDDEVVADCRECIAEVSEPAAAHPVVALREALHAFEAGLVVPCQAAVASVLSDVINRALELSIHVAAKELAEDPAEMPISYIRFWLIASTVPHALAQYRCQNGDPIPDRFKRHASAHTADPRQVTKLNALMGLMLAVGLVREIASELTGGSELSRVRGTAMR